MAMFRGRWWGLNTSSTYKNHIRQLKNIFGISTNKIWAHRRKKFADFQMYKDIHAQIHTSNF